MENKENTNQSILPIENKEAVDETIAELHAEKTKSFYEKEPFYKKLGKYILYPFTIPLRLGKRLTKRIKIPLTYKLTIIYTIVFALILGFFSIFFLASVQDKLDNSQETIKYFKNLRITTIVLYVVLVIIFMALVTVVSTLMLNPIRKISNRIDTITSEDLSARLEIIDTQDELMELTDRINGMLDNIEESFERQQNFVADASHELKTPIAVIQGYSNLLKRWGTQKQDVMQESIEAIVRESENMKRIVDQLLLLARLGQMNMNKSVFNICEVLDDVVEGYRVVNTSHKIRFWGEEEILAETDKNLLVESVRAIVDNAIKYTPAGGEIDVRCGLDDETLRISVSDTGPGISKENQAKIFDRFFRCDKSRGREKGSTGLGLTIAKSIVEMMGGNIHVVSEEGKGAEFVIELY